MSFKNAPYRFNCACSLRIGDETHTARTESRVTTTRKANALSLGDIVRCYFCDYLGSKFGGFYRVVEVHPAVHEGNYRTFVLEKCDKEAAR